jgi:spermidine/putrescine transport system substrate-binding protein
VSWQDDHGSAATRILPVLSWLLYLADGFVPEFQKTSHLTVDYKEDYNNDEEWFAKNKEPPRLRAALICIEPTGRL